MSRGAFWSWLVIIAGLILIMTRLGLVAAGVGFWQLFWPSALILFGVSRLQRRMKRQFTLPEGEGQPAGALAANTDESFNVALDEGTHKSDIQIAPIGSALTIQPGIEDGTLIIGRATTPFSRHSEQIGVIQKLHLSAKGSDVGHWDFWLSPLVSHRLKVILGTARSQIDLSPLDITTLTLNRSSGPCTVLLPEAGDCRVEIEGGPGRLILITAPMVAASISAPDSTELELDNDRFPGDHGLYQSPNWERAASRVWIEIGAGSGKIIIR